MYENTIGNRMKANYEFRDRHYLTRRTPVIIRLDMKCGSSYTAPLRKKDSSNAGWNLEFMEVMDKTAENLVREIQGAELAYVQSDEISVLLNDFKNLNSDAWFDYCQSKIESVSASIASATFTIESWRIWKQPLSPIVSVLDLVPAYFDSRSFNLPEAEVVNYFIWRQKDAERNSLNLLAQTLYSHKELQGKNRDALFQMCEAKGRVWGELDAYLKRGRCVSRVNVEENGAIRSKIVVDKEIPIFTQDREYIEKHLVCND